MLHAESCWFFFFPQSLFISQNQHSPIFFDYLISGGFSFLEAVSAAKLALHAMCKHIIMACLGVGIIYFISETLFQCSTSPEAKSLSDIVQSTSHSVHLSLTVTKCTGSDTGSRKQYSYHDTYILISKEVGQGI